jgi:hypothetical protein
VIHSSTVGPLAQRLEQRTHNPLVEGSNPSGPTISDLQFARTVAMVIRLDAEFVEHGQQ